MNKARKVEVAGQLKKKFSDASVALFADFKGLNANDADILRRLLRQQNAEVKVLKNNVARLTMSDGGLGAEAKDLMDRVVGQTLVAFAYGDPAASAKVMHTFAREHGEFRLKESLMGQKRIDVAGVEELATLPAREVLIAKVLGTMNAPISSFVGVLAAVPRSLVTVLAAIEKKKSAEQA